MHRDLHWEEFDISANEELKKEITTRAGRMAVPIIEIGDEIIVGFDKARIDKLLEE